MVDYCREWIYMHTPTEKKRYIFESYLAKKKNIYIYINNNDNKNKKNLVIFY